MSIERHYPALPPDGRIVAIYKALAGTTLWRMILDGEGNAWCDEYHDGIYSHSGGMPVEWFEALLPPWINQRSDNEKEPRN